MQGIYNTLAINVHVTVLAGVLFLMMSDVSALSEPLFNQCMWNVHGLLGQSLL